MNTDDTNQRPKSRRYQLTPMKWGKKKVIASYTITAVVKEAVIRRAKEITEDKGMEVSASVAAESILRKDPSIRRLVAEIKKEEKTRSNQWQTKKKGTN